MNSYDEQALSLFNSSTNKLQVETQHINLRRMSVKRESYVIVLYDIISPKLTHRWLRKQIMSLKKINVVTGNVITAF